MALKPEKKRIPAYEELVQKATHCFGTEEAALRWLQSPHPALDGKVPFVLAEEPGGIQRVKDAIGRIEHGILA